MFPTVPVLNENPGVDADANFDVGLGLKEKLFLCACSSLLLSSSASLSLFLRELLSLEVTAGELKEKLLAGLSVELLTGLLNENGDGFSPVGAGMLNEKGFGASALSFVLDVFPNENDLGASAALLVELALVVLKVNGEGLLAIAAGLLNEKGEEVGFSVEDATGATFPNENVGFLSSFLAELSSSSVIVSFAIVSGFFCGLPRKDDPLSALSDDFVIENPSTVFLPNETKEGAALLDSVDLSVSLVTEAKGEGDAAATA